MALEYKPLGVRIYSVAPGVYPTTRFGANTGKWIEEGDDQLGDLSKRLRAQIIAVGEQMATRGGSLANSQEVADRRATPRIHNPTGGDAEMLIQMMGQDKRQTFLDQLEAMLVPRYPTPAHRLPSAVVQELLDEVRSEG